MKKGFTLIELLVVVAIIALLATMVFVSLSAARGKAKDARVKGSLSSYRSAAEVYAADKDSYAASSADNVCTGSDTYGLQNIRADIFKQTGEAMSCNATANAWAASAKLSDGGYWCVDSQGKNNAGQNSDASCP